MVVAVGLGAGSIGALAATAASLVWGTQIVVACHTLMVLGKAVWAPGNGPGTASESLVIEVGICCTPILVAPC